MGDDGADRTFREGPDVVVGTVYMTQVHVDVLIVGAGLSGIGAACVLRRECPDKSFAILEARDVIGGTWDLFRYPGVRSDSDMFTLGYSFRPWRAARAIADGSSILLYIRDTACEYGVDREIRFGHRVVAADWDGSTARWAVTAQRSDGMTARFTCSWLSVCAGYYDYDAGYRPGFPGEELFAGVLVHPQQWPTDLDWTGRRVVVIGSGATAVTLVPSLAKRAEKVTMVQRTPSYIVSIPANDPLAPKLKRLLPSRIAHGIIRWKSIGVSTLSYQFARRQPESMKALVRKGLIRALPREYDVDRHFSPPYNPWDQRLCLVPDGDLFAALSTGRAEVVTERIETFTPTGIRLGSGEEIQADIIVTATGLSILALGGMQLTVDGEQVDLSRTVAYKAMMLSGVPNFNLVIGYTNSSWTLKADLVNRYVVRLLKFLDRRGYDRATPVPPTGEPADQPFLDFQAGYVTRAIDQFPRQGRRAPWRLYQNYFRDVLLMRYSRLQDEGMVFSAGRPAGRSPRRDRAGKGRGGVKRPFDFASGTVIVTGAASGIGEELTYRLARRGSALALVDRDAERLGGVARAARAVSRRPVTTYVVDLADTTAARRLGTTLAVAHPDTSLLINNAGVALRGMFEQVSEEEFDWLMAINFQAVVTLTRALVPVLRGNAGSHVVNVSSIFGIIAPAGQVAYCSSKFAVRGFTEALRAELSPSVGVTVVHPGGIRTRIARTARIAAAVPAEQAAAGSDMVDRLLSFPPEKAAARIIRAVERRRPRLLIGMTAVLPDLVARASPARVPALLAMLQRVGTVGKRSAGSKR